MEAGGDSSSEGGPDPLAGRALVAKVGPRGGPSSFVLPRAQGLCLADFRAHIVNYLQDRWCLVKEQKIH